MSQTHQHLLKQTPLIYVVDDEPLLLDLAEITLAPGGYKVRTFLDPELALEQFLGAKAKPALLITDYSMGKMNGLELVDKCRAVKPDLKSILISGTAGAEIVLGSDIKVDRFVGKPYQPSSLAELVRRILGLDAAA
jgi:CheY-like chemotaxis protein